MLHRVLSTEQAPIQVARIHDTSRRGLTVLNTREPTRPQRRLGISLDLESHD